MQSVDWRRTALTYLAAGLMFAAMLTMPRIFYTLSAADTDAAPEFAVDSTEYDFGVVLSGTVLRKTFSVRNDGGQRLLLNRETCCGDPAPAPVVVPPGTSVPLELSIPTAGHQGPMRHSVRFSTSAPAQPSVTFTFLADVTEGSRVGG